MAQMNKTMSPHVETIFMFSNPRLFFSSSHLIKEVAGYGKRLPELVPEIVIERLRAKLKVGEPKDLKR
jgi:pantetheine-phosphate adenylyltransferase